MNTSVRSNSFVSGNQGIRVLADGAHPAVMLANQDIHLAAIRSKFMRINLRSNRLNSKSLVCLFALLCSSIAPAAYGAVVFTEAFDDLNDWTVVDADGAGTTNVVEAVGGKLHVFNSSNNGLGAGLYQTAANAPVTGRIYFWGFQAATNGPQGVLNLSTTSGLHFFSDTPMGVYLPERTGPLIRPQIIVDNDNPGAEGLVNPNVSYDFFLEYSNSPNVGLFYKLSSETNASDWSQIHVHLTYDDSVSPYFINMLGRGPVSSSEGLNADWLLDQIDITGRDDALLVAPMPIPEPSSLALLLAGAFGLFMRTRMWQKSGR